MGQELRYKRDVPYRIVLGELTLSEGIMRDRNVYVFKVRGGGEWINDAGHRKLECDPDGGVTWRLDPTHELISVEEQQRRILARIEHFDCRRRKKRSVNDKPPERLLASQA